MEEFKKQCSNLSNRTWVTHSLSYPIDCHESFQQHSVFSPD
jgi:hypothetical protein